LLALRNSKKVGFLTRRSSFHPGDEARSSGGGESGDMVVPGSIELWDDWTTLGISFWLGIVFDLNFGLIAQAVEIDYFHYCSSPCRHLHASVWSFMSIS